MKLRVFLILTNIGVVSPFSFRSSCKLRFVHNGHTCKHSYDRSSSQLHSIPKPEERKQVKVNASAFGYRNDYSNDDFSEMELNRQHLELEEFVQSPSFIESFDNNLSEFSAEEHVFDGSVTEETKYPWWNEIWQARVMLLIAAALYGTNFTFVKVLNENMPLEFGTFLRFSLAAMSTMPFLFSKQSSMVKGSDDAQNIQKYGAIIGGLEVGIWNAMGYLFQAIGLETTPASTSSFICSLAVVTVPILDYLTGKKILRNEVIGLVMAVAGVAFLELDGLGEGLQMSQGDILSLVQPLAFGMGFWRMEHYMRKFPQDAMKLTAGQLMMVAISSMGLFLYSNHGVFPEVMQIMEWLSNPVIGGSILWTGLITTALTVGMETYALKTLSAAETTMLFSTEPIFGALTASVVLGEAFGSHGLIGSALVLGGCLYSNLGGNKASGEIQ